MDDDSDDSFNDDFEGEGDSDVDDDLVVERKVEYVVLDEKDLEERKRSLEQDVAETLDLPLTTCSMLLRANAWNKEKITANYFDNGHKMLQDIGLATHTDSMDQSAGEGEGGGEEEFECPICDEDFPSAEGHHVGCGHTFCLGCWKDYIDQRINESGKDAVLSKCAMFKCEVCVPDSSVKKVASALAWKKYSRMVLRSFVEDSRTLKWCPAPRCDHAVEGLSPGLGTVKCSCNFEFCFQCNEENHAPASCSNLSLWLDKCRNESETAHWIIANTKKCPKCSIRIEKNQGCNHMTCRSCKYEFCWVCDGNWADHGNHTGGFYKCNKYNPKAKKDSSGKVQPEEAAKAELNRYLHYYQRYHNHDQSKKFADKQRQLTNKRMTDFQRKTNSSTWIDVQFLKDATEQVFACRQVLKNTYVFAYYLEEGHEKTLFEYLQQQLETSTEKLSELSESKFEKLDRTEVVNYTRVTGKFMENLLEGVANGLTGS